MSAIGARPRARDVFPPYLYEAYRATIKRSPREALIELPDLTLSELTGPGDAIARVLPEDADLTTNAGTGVEAMGERMIVTGRVLDETGAALPGTLLEIWQANAAGRYRHRVDQHHAPLDPNFIGIGRCLTDGSGTYHFTTIRPGAYPYPNGENDWRAPHIHFSLFGPEWRSRLITQMYFPGDPLRERDAILSSVPTTEARERLVAAYAHDVTKPFFALGYRFDIVLGGTRATPLEGVRAVESAAR